MDHEPTDDATGDTTLDDACWDALDVAAGIHDPVERLVALQELTDQVGVALERLESAKVAALAEALLDLSVERLTLQLGVDDDVVEAVRRSWSDRPPRDGTGGVSRG